MDTEHKAPRMKRLVFTEEEKRERELHNLHWQISELGRTIEQLRANAIMDQYRIEKYEKAEAARKAAAAVRQARHREKLNKE